LGLHFFSKWSFIGVEDRKKKKAGGSPLQPKFDDAFTYFFFAVFFAVAFFAAGFFAAAFLVAIQFTSFLSLNNRGDLSNALP
jgi:hypothetical protein